MKRIAVTVVLALWLALTIAPGARAAGGPVPAVQSSPIAVPGSPYRYAAFPASGRTVVKGEGVGSPASELRLSGRYGIPGVDYSGSLTGLSADGRTLILAEIPAQAPPRTTRLIVLDTAPLAVRTRLTLRGWWTVDAISPDGRWLYLIHYPSSDVSKYEVRAYDLSAHRLLTEPVVDPRERDEAMTGFPIGRVMSPDRRWAYTLYFRPSGVPFIHALDTSRRRAVCVDLPSLGDDNAANAHLGLGPGGTTLRVSGGGLTWATIDTRTFKVSSGADPSATVRLGPVARGHRPARGDSHVPWELLVLIIAAVAAVAAAGVTRLARSRRHPKYMRGPDGAVLIHVDARDNQRARADDELPVA